MVVGVHAILQSMVGRLLGQDQGGVGPISWLQWYLINRDWRPHQEMGEPSTDTNQEQWACWDWQLEDSWKDCLSCWCLAECGSPSSLPQEAPWTHFSVCLVAILVRSRMWWKKSDRLDIYVKKKKRLNFFFVNLFMFCYIVLLSSYLDSTYKWTQLLSFCCWCCCSRTYFISKNDTQRWWGEIVKGTERYRLSVIK